MNMESIVTRNKDLIVIAGRTGSGKTVYAVSLARNAIEARKEDVAYFSLIESKDEIAKLGLASEYVFDDCPAGIKEICDFARGIKAKRDFKLLIIDSFLGTESVVPVKQVAMDLDIPVILVCQIPSLGSGLPGDIKQNADVVLML
jgi:KaiC/GvpD/RAD55 family RecA-like ATPase